MRGWWLTAWVLAGCGRIGFDAMSSDAPPPIDVQAAQLTVGWAHACLRTGTGEAYCWGSNASGQLGTGTTTNELRPTLTTIGLTWIDLSAGENHTCGIDEQNLAYCWGDSTNGQLGNGMTIPTRAPAPLGDGRRYTRIFAGSRHTCAIATDRTLWCWGRNGARQLGVGLPNTDRLSPTQVLIVAPQTGPDNDWIAVGPGDDHTCALQGNGTAWCFGSDGSGQLGQGGSAMVVRERPEIVDGLQRFTAISAGRDYSYGVDTMSRKVGWGANGGGQLGFGDTMSRDSPTASALGSYDQISCGLTHACARATDQTLWCWGNNVDGRIGIGVKGADQRSPVLVAGAWLAVGAGTAFTCGLDRQQAVWCWGSGANGQLGTGDTDPALTPTQITNLPR